MGAGRALARRGGKEVLVVEHVWLHARGARMCANVCRSRGRVLARKGGVFMLEVLHALDTNKRKV